MKTNVRKLALAGLLVAVAVVVIALKRTKAVKILNDGL